ncbi:Hypothetical protein P9515_13301 [Prochlorococcus marinus str. MIT 9515]|uniref:Glycosyltransferase RgtA/B/C/D-like domain-containing protein n=2 Tax=Prochlorococcus marinus TaxID=1219 RepID=A2BXM6_PROM5|nr:Hypothetical protein P9515_13301 [Prochlorococcus marinus str. MIT 9515]
MHTYNMSVIFIQKMISKSNKENLVNYFNSIKFSFWKPSLIFYLLAVFSFLFWLIIGPSSWRNVDDYGTFFDVIKKINSFESSNNFPLSSQIAYPIDFQSIKPINLLQATLKTCREGWGTYPPLWGFIYLPLTIPFLKFGLDWTRFATLVVGFISAVLTAYLLSNNITTIFYSFKDKIRIKNFQRIRYLIDFLSILIVCFNPELMLHASSYMPYQLPAISTLICLSLFTSFYTYQIKINGSNQTFSNKTFDIPLLYTLLIIWLSSLLGFQTIFLYLGILLASFYFLFTEKQPLKIIKKIYRKNSVIFINKKPKFYSTLGITFSISLLLGFSKYHYFKLISIISQNEGTAQWAYGDGLLYKLDLQSYSLNTNFIHLVHAISRLASLSIYPFRNGQGFSSFVLFLFVIPSFVFLFRVTKLSRIVALIIFSVLLITISFSFKGNYAFAPSRHNIYLFPCFWIPVITYFVYLCDQAFYNFWNFKFLLPISLSLFFTIGLFVSTNSVNYTNYQREKLYQMADKSNIYPSTIGQHDLWSLYWTHGDKEWSSVVGKECSINNRITSTNLAFIYGHSEPLQLNNEEQRKSLEVFSDGCIKKSDSLQIVDSYEFKRDIHFEMDKFVGWSGSSAYGYLISKLN